MAAEKKPDTLPRILVVRICGGWVSEIDMHCRLFSNAAMQLENHVLVMCIALRQLFGVHACRTMAVEVVLPLAGRAILGFTFSHDTHLQNHISFSNGTCASFCRRGNKSQQPSCTRHVPWPAIPYSGNSNFIRRKDESDPCGQGGPGSADGG